MTHKVTTQLKPEVRMFAHNTGGGSGYDALLAHMEGVLYGMELGSVTLKINNQHTLAPTGTPPFWRTRKEFCTVWNSAR